MPVLGVSVTIIEGLYRFAQTRLHGFWIHRSGFGQQTAHEDCIRVGVNALSQIEGGMTATAYLRMASSFPCIASTMKSASFSECAGANLSTTGIVPNFSVASK